MTRRSPIPTPARDRRQEARTILCLEMLEDRTLLSAALAPSAPAPYDPTQVLVQFRPEALASGGPTLNVSGATLGQAFDLVPGLYDVRLNGLSVPDALALLRADARVLSAEPDYLVATSGTPNDPQFGAEWGLSNTGQSGGTAGVDVHATQAWNITTGGAVVVALIDTGVDYNHPDLYQNIWVNQGEIPKSRRANLIDVDGDGLITFRDLNDPRNQGAGKITDVNKDGRIDASDILAPMTLNAQGQDTGQGGWSFSGNTQDGDKAHPNDFFGWNFVANNNNPFDDNGHGSNVAGVLGATGNNGVGIAGLDWRVQMQALKAFDASGFSSISEIISAFSYSIQHGAKISNNSWSVSDYSSDLLNALTNARAAGQIVVAAAGNNGAATPNYPALYAPQLDNIVSVAAIDHSGNLWANSNYGASTVTLAAPGVNILGAAPGGGYQAYTGTSQAVPFVTGTLALVWGQHPTWTYKQVIAQVTGTTTHLASLAGKTITGGLVNAAAAVGATSPGGGGVPTQSPTPTVLGAAFSGPDSHSLNRVIVTFDRVMNASTFTPSQVHLVDPSGQAVTVTTKLAPGSNGSQFEIDFATQTAGGTYTLSIGSGVHDASGTALAPYSATYVLTPATVSFTSAGPVPIPDLSKAVSTITVNQDVLIGSLQITLNISHTYDSDLFIHLQAPDGTDILLVNRIGGSGDNFQNTILADTAATSIRSAAAPFKGTFQAESPLSSFNGKNARGVWKLWVEDRAAGDVGVINSWTLTIKPGPRVASQATGEKAAAPLVTGASLAATAPQGSAAVPAHTAAVDVVFQSLGGTHPTAVLWLDSWRSLLGGSSHRPDDDWTVGLP